jgi:hypothetical protein
VLNFVRPHGWIVAFAAFALACSSENASTTQLASDAAPSDGAIADASAMDGTAMDEAPPDSPPPIDAAGDAGAIDCGVGPQGEPTDLRCTGLYSDWDSKTVSSGATQYDPGLHLWSDGADKTRWIDLPANTTIDTSDMDEWVFPTGTKVWKEFVLGGHRIETRLLWKQTAAAWYMTTYRWSADESSATELVSGATNADGNGYEIPSQGQCHTCHNGRQDVLLGFEAVSMSSPGASGMSMSTLVANGLLTAPPTAPITIPGSPTAVAALGYLHMNCGTSCHNAGSGDAYATGLFMRLLVAELATGQVTNTDTYITAVNKMSHFTIPGDAGPTYRLAPHSAQTSSVYYRMSQRDLSQDAGTQMPPVDSHKVDEAGTAVIRAWIDAGCQ